MTTFGTQGPTVTVTQQFVGAQLEPVKITRQEELQFGMDYAPMMRRLGRAATEIEQALFQAEGLLRDAMQADDLSRGLTDPPPMNEAGQTEYTAWVASLTDRLGALRNSVNIALAEVGMQCIQREHGHRTGPSGGEADGTPVTRSPLTEMAVSAAMSAFPNASLHVARADALVAHRILGSQEGVVISDALDPGEWYVG